MSQPLKIVAIVVGAIVALVIAAVIIVPLLFDPNDYKGQIASQARSATGRDLHIEGDLDLSVFPWLGVQTGRLSLENAEGFGDAPFLTLERADVRVKLLPLLQRRLEVGKIVVEGLRVDLQRDASGRTNWDDLIERDTAPAPEQGPEPAPELEIAGLELRDATVSWRDAQAQTSYVISGLSLETGALRPGEPVDVDLALTVADGVPGYTADLKLAGTLQADTEAGRYGADDLALEYVLREKDGKRSYEGSLTGKVSADTAQSVYSLQDVKLAGELPAMAPDAPPLRIAGAWSTARYDQAANVVAADDITLEAAGVKATVTQLQGTNLQESPRVTGVLDVAPFSLPELLKTLAVGLPEGADPSKLGTASLRAQVVAEPSAPSFALTNLRAEALGMRLEGELRSAGGKLAGTLRAPEFQTATLFAALGNALPQDVNLRAIDRLALDASFETDTTTGALVIRNAKASLLGTTVTADVRVTDLGGPTARYTGSVRTGAVAPQQVAAVFGALLPAGIEPKELGELSIGTRFDMREADHVLELEKLDANAAGLHVTGALTLSKFPDATEYAGNLTVDRFNPRALMKRFGQKPPVTADPKAFRAVSASARIAATATSARLESLDLRVDQTRLSGSLAITDIDNPAYEFDLAIDDADVDRYLPPMNKGEEQQEQIEETGDIVIPVDTLKTLRMSGKVQAKAIKIGGIRVSNLAATLAARDGLARLEPVSARLYEGEFSGAFTAEARGKTPAMTVKGQVTKMRVGQFLKDMSGGEEPTLTGRGTFNLELAGAGATYLQNLGSADGTVSFSLNDGAVAGLDLAHSLCTGFNLVKKLPKPTAKARKNSHFEQLSGSAVVTDGVATTKDLKGSTDFLTATGGGTIDLAKQTVDIDLTATMTAPIKLAGCAQTKELVGDSLPIDISGTITEPSVKPDFGQIVKDVVKEKVQEEIKEKLLDILGDKAKKTEKKP